ncbi:MAG: hydrogenase nickel incorporation protein HypB [Caulobacterales bacterium]|nr:hydrogenase nickel incorporation protein HypB [Caulobacterales bacterium]
MCKVCGCGEGETRIEGAPNQHDHHHHHDHDHAHGPDGALDFGAGPAGAHAPGLSQSRMVEIEQNILAKNDAYAGENRARFEEAGVLALNLVSSPGAGKTTLLVETIGRLEGKVPLSVIEGDQQTANDADRIRATGAPAIQVNTGKGCHLDAHMIGHAADHLGLVEESLLFIENVGNLVCPSGFDLGEAAKVVLLSVTEGDDKPLKYPDMFAASALMLVTKTDLAPHVDFDIARCVGHARTINPDIAAIEVSAKTGAGMDEWLGWIAARRAEALSARVARLQDKLARAQASAGLM